MRKLGCVIFLLFLGLAACSGQAPAIEPSPMIPMLTPYSTLTPTSTPTFLLGRSHTMLATSIAGATQTAQQDDIDCAGHPESRRYVDDAKSPNGSWRINLCTDPQTGSSYTKFIQVSGFTTWEVPFYETFGKTRKSSSNPEGYKDGQMVVAHWSSDGRFAYLYPFVCCMDGPVLFNGVYALYRLDLSTGESKTIFSSGGHFKFSPDDKYLAYRTIPPAVHLLDLASGDDASFSLDKKYATVGFFSWAPDGRKLVFVAPLQHWEDGWPDYAGNPNGYSLLLLNKETMKVSALIDNDLRRFVPEVTDDKSAWIGNDKIYLAGREEGKTYIYDIGKQQLILFSTPTPPAPSRSPAPTSQEDPFPTPSPNPTALALEKEWGSNGPVLLSPDGQWGVSAFSTGNQMIVTNIVTALTRTVPCSLFSRSCASIEAIHWSKDSRYLYLASSIMWGETSLGQPLFSELGRIDLQSGKFEKLINNLDISTGDGFVISRDNYDFSISPDDRYLAYVKSSNDDEGKVEFVVLTTDKWKEKEKRALAKGSAGNIVWSPSSDHLVFVAVNDVAYYDLNTKILRYTVQNEQGNALFLLGWDVKTNLVRLMKESWIDRIDSYWYLNPFTGEILPVLTPTPRP